MEQIAKQRVNKKAVLTAFIIVCVFVFLEKFIFELFGITIPAFKITGGIMIFHVSFEMLQSKKSKIKHLQTINIDENIAISPFRFLPYIDSNDIPMDRSVITRILHY